MLFASRAARNAAGIFSVRFSVYSGAGRTAKPMLPSIVGRLTGAAVLQA